MSLCKERGKECRLCVIGLTITLILGCGPWAAAQTGATHTCYVAADEVEWNYAPSGINQITGKSFEGNETIFAEHGPHRIGLVYKKALYREYTDETFTRVKPRPADQTYLGLLGPILRGEVGDTLRIVFKNHTSHPCSMHPHGVFYNKDSEGTPYQDGTSGADKADDAVPPGGTHVYTWKIPERAGPGPDDPSSLVWLYHSHTNESEDVETGLIGAIIVTRRGMARPDGRPKDVDREFVTLFMIFDENQSWFLHENIEKHTTDPKGVNTADLVPFDLQDRFSLFGRGFAAANFKSSINGYLYGNQPMMTMKTGERVRWYVVTMGTGINFHTPHWHGNVVMDHGHRTDVIAISPAQMETVDMIPDDPGVWMYHCHVDDHMDAGMITRYQVLP
jgi:FtsP/CotA-like multicopper oxidase with cupredoxin domain